MVDDGKELRDKMEEVGGEVKEEHGVNVVKSSLEVLESGVGDEKVEENSDGMNDGECMQGVIEVGSDDVDVNVVDVTAGQSDEVPELKGADVEEMSREMGSSDVGGDIQKLGLSSGKEVGHEETSEVNATGECHQLDKPVVQEGINTRHAEVQINDTSTIVAEHNATGELDKLVLQEGTDTQHAEVQIDDTPTTVAEQNATGELDKPVVQEGTDTQDAEVQIDDDTPTAVAEHNATGELEKPVVQEGTDTQDSEVQIDDDTPTAVAEHNATGELEKPVVQEGTDTQDAEVQIDDDAPTAVFEHNAIEKFQNLEVGIHVLPEVIGNVTQDAEVQISGAATGMAEHSFSTNVKDVPVYANSAAEDKSVHTKNLELMAAVECQADVVITKDTVNSVLREADTESNAIVENNGDKMDVLSQVDFDTDGQPENGMSQMEWALSNEQVDESKTNHFVTPEMEFQHVKVEDPKAGEEKLNSSLFLEGDESGTEEERIAFFREVETFFKARGTDFRAPKFYGEPLNLLKLWRAVIRLGGYEQVTSCKLWRQIGESFNPPKTCTTVSWTFRLFYEKTLLEFEKHKMQGADLPYNNSFTELDTETQSGGSQSLGSGRVMRDSAARAMQGWHSHQSPSNGGIDDPIIKDKSPSVTLMREKHTKNHDFTSLKRKTTYPTEQPSKLARSKPQMEISVIDAGEPANWVKINIRKTKDCFEIYALVPGLTREEVRVQSDPAGRLVISGEPLQLDNPWGVTPFKKVVSLPSRTDPHQTSAVVTLHGLLFVRVPFG